MVKILYGVDVVKQTAASLWCLCGKHLRPQPVSAHFVTFMSVSQSHCGPVTLYCGQVLQGHSPQMTRLVAGTIRPQVVVWAEDEDCSSGVEN